MAYDPNEQFANATRAADKRVFPEHVRPKTFAPVSGGGTLTKCTPVGFSTSLNKWVVWANAGANGEDTVRGFVWPDDIVLSDSGGDNYDVLGQVMLTGTIHFDDIVVPSGETEANLKAKLRADARDLGLHIDGLDQVR